MLLKCVIFIEILYSKNRQALGNPLDFNGLRLPPVLHWPPALRSIPTRLPITNSCPQIFRIYL